MTENKGLTSDKPRVVQPESGFMGQLRGFGAFMFNKDEKSVMGRNALSWAKIGLFYLVFYAILAGFFAGYLQIFFLTFDSEFPKQRGMTSLLKNNPGMGFRPQPDIESTLIHFVKGDVSSYKKYTDSLEEFLKKYEDSPMGDAKCEHPDDGIMRNSTQSCRFQNSELGTKCTKANHYGYEDGQPCVLLKMNRIYGYEPVPFTNVTQIPQEAKDAGIVDGSNWSPESVGITCEGQNPGDQQNMGKVEFQPQTGFSMTYLPYLNQADYLSPLVMVKFNNPTHGVLIQMWCKLWTQDIYHHKNDRAGSVMFELMVEKSDNDNMADKSTTTPSSFKYDVTETS